MKQILRRLISISKLLPLLLFITSLVIWLASYAIGLQVLYSKESRVRGFTANAGYFWFYSGVRFQPNRDGDGFVFRLRSLNAPPADSIGNWNEVYLGDDAGGIRLRCFVAQGWKVCCIFALLAARRPLRLIEKRIITHRYGNRFAWGSGLLLLSTSMIALWPVSYWRVEGLVVEPWNHSMFGVAVFRGSLLAIWGNVELPNGMRIDSINEPAAIDPFVHQWLNFVWLHNLQIRGVGMPLWLCALLFAYLSLKILFDQKRSIPGRCGVCGYDMRATPQRCPECGTVPANKVAVPG